MARIELTASEQQNFMPATTITDEEIRAFQVEMRIFFFLK